MANYPYCSDSELSDDFARLRQAKVIDGSAARIYQEISAKIESNQYAASVAFSAFFGPTRDETGARKISLKDVATNIGCDPTGLYRRMRPKINPRLIMLKRLHLRYVEGGVSLHKLLFGVEAMQLLPPPLSAMVNAYNELPAEKKELVTQFLYENAESKAPDEYNTNIALLLRKRFYEQADRLGTTPRGLFQDSHNRSIGNAVYTILKGDSYVCQVPTLMFFAKYMGVCVDYLLYEDYTYSCDIFATSWDGGQYRVDGDAKKLISHYLRSSEEQQKEIILYILSLFTKI